MRPTVASQHASRVALVLLHRRLSARPHAPRAEVVATIPAGETDTACRLRQSATRASRAASVMPTVQAAASMLMKGASSPRQGRVQQCSALPGISVLEKRRSYRNCVLWGRMLQ